jgi:HNH endonuclease.
MSEKRCSLCGEVKTLDEFNRDKKRADGRQRRCRRCAQAHYRENRDERAAYNRAYYQQNRAEVRARARTYRQENRDVVLERERAYRKVNAAYWAEHNAYLEHPTGKKECRRKHGWMPVSSFSRHSNAADGLSVTCRECAHATGETRGDRAAWTEIARTRPPCVYCDDPSGHIDHVHPVSRGGRDIATNYVPACQPCNSSKNATYVYDYLFGAADRPDDEKPSHYRAWDAPFLTSFFAELEHQADACP